MRAKRLGFMLVAILCLCATYEAEGSNPCFATLAGNFDLNLPALEVDGATYAVNLAFSASGPIAGGLAWFRATGITTSSLTGCGNPASLIIWPDRVVARLPLVLYGADEAFWADLQYVPTNDGQVWLSLVAGGVLSHRVFVTSVQGQGNLSAWPDSSGILGIAAGDAICEARAHAAGLTGAYVAWLSDDELDAYCRVHGLVGKISNHCGQATLPASAGPWVRTDGFPFADRIDLLTGAGKVLAPARSNEFGDPAPSVWYFTNTEASGALTSFYASPCQNWTANTSDNVGAGITDWTTGGWTQNASMTCDSNGSLLCFEIGPGPALPNFAVPGKKAFVTSISGGGNLSGWAGAGGHSGLMAGDAICQARAQASGLANANRFKAWLSNGTTNARDRIVSNGPWVRLDGVLVAENKADLTDGSVFTTINLTETGVYRSIFEYIWTGTHNDGTKSADNCNGWSDGSATGQGTIGRAWDTGAWSGSGQTPCDWSNAIYCLED